MVDVTRDTKDLELAKENHAAVELLCLSEELQSIKVEQFTISKDLNKVRDEKSLFLNQLENIKTKLALAESRFSEAKDNETKFLEDAMQD